jgi:hypothetical protein
MAAAVDTMIVWATINPLSRLGGATGYLGIRYGMPR